MFLFRVLSLLDLFYRYSFICPLVYNLSLVSEVFSDIVFSFYLCCRKFIVCLLNTARIPHETSINIYKSGIKNQVEEILRIKLESRSKLDALYGSINHIDIPFQYHSYCWTFTKHARIQFSRGITQVTPN